MRLVRASVLCVLALAPIAACVDLFHSTNLPTLCTEDASACVADTADASIDLCRGDAQAAAERACGHLGACLGTANGSSFGDCMFRALAAFDCKLNPHLRPSGKTAVLWQCLGSASSCTDVEQCVFDGHRPACTGNAPGSSSTCGGDGGTAVVECTNGAALGMNACTLGGQSCARIDGTKSVCSGTGGVPCSGTAARCTGTAAIQCRDLDGTTYDDGIDCAAVGAGSCAADSDGVACRPVATAPPCTTTSAVACTDGGASSCVGGRTVTIACGALGLGCNAAAVPTYDPMRACTRTDDASAGCAAGGDECSSPTKLRSCLRGSPIEIDCSKIPGLDHCATGVRPSCKPK